MSDVIDAQTGTIYTDYEQIVPNAPAPVQAARRFVTGRNVLIFGAILGVLWFVWKKRNN